MIGRNNRQKLSELAVKRSAVKREKVSPMRGNPTKSPSLERPEHHSKGDAEFAETRRRLLKQHDWVGLAYTRPIKLHFASHNEKQNIAKRRRIHGRKQRPHLRREYLKSQNLAPLLEDSPTEEQYYMRGALQPTDDVSVRIGRDVEPSQPVLGDIEDLVGDDNSQDTMLFDAADPMVEVEMPLSVPIGEEAPWDNESNIEQLLYAFDETDALSDAVRNTDVYRDRGSRTKYLVRSPGTCMKDNTPDPENSNSVSSAAGSQTVTSKSSQWHGQKFGAVNKVHVSDSCPDASDMGKARQPCVRNNNRQGTAASPVPGTEDKRDNDYPYLESINVESFQAHGEARSPDEESMTRVQQGLWQMDPCINDENEVIDQMATKISKPERGEPEHDEENTTVCEIPTFTGRLGSTHTARS